MNPALILSILKLVADGTPAVLRMIDDIRAGRQPSDADWLEIEALANYSSAEAMKK